MTDVLLDLHGPESRTRPDHPDQPEVRAANLTGLITVTRSSASAAQQFILSDNGASLIARFEGLYLKAYDDPVGYCTIGVGHLLAYSRCTGAEPAITEAEAYRLLSQDAASAAAALANAITVTLNQNQIDALISWTFNVGNGAMASSTLIRRLNTGDYASVPSELMRWAKAGGSELPGLVTRRRAEGELFASTAVQPGPGPGPVPIPLLKGETDMPAGFIPAYDPARPQDAQYMGQYPADPDFDLVLFSDNVGSWDPNAGAVDPKTHKPVGAWRTLPGSIVRVAAGNDQDGWWWIEELWVPPHVIGRSKPPEHKGKGGGYIVVSKGPNGLSVYLHFKDGTMGAAAPLPAGTPAGETFGLVDPTPEQQAQLDTYLAGLAS